MRKLKKSYKKLVLAALSCLMVLILAGAVNPSALAAIPGDSSSNGTSADNGTSDTTAPPASAHPCHPEQDKPPGQPLTQAQLQSCEACQNANNAPSCLKADPITKDLNTIVNFLSAGVGIIVVAMIIVGGIQYSLAGDSSEGVTKAKQRIFNGLIALVAFIFIYAFLQWIIPGGIFG